MSRDTDNFQTIRQLLDEIRKRLDRIEASARQLTEQGGPDAGH